MIKTLFLSAFLMLLLSGTIFPATVILNSQDYRDIISSAVYASYNEYQFVFALTPEQAVFLTQYYTTNPDDKIIYIEGERPILPNMAKIIKDKGIEDLESVTDTNIQNWVADRLNKDEAIIVGSQYGQDALSVSSYAAMSGSPIFFVDQASEARSLFEEVSARGYGKVIVYGPIAHQVSNDDMDLFTDKKIIDTGSRYSNNLEITKMFLEQRSTQQVILVSGKAFEKSMVDKSFPILLVGRSDVPKRLVDFMTENNIASGVVFHGDGDIVDGATKLKNSKDDLSIYVKFGEGYSVSPTPLPLVVTALPAPVISVDMMNLTYNVPNKNFELRLINNGDFVSLAAGVSVDGVGAAESSEILLEPGTETTISIGLDASSAINEGKIDAVDVTVRYGEDSALMDNIDTQNYIDIPASYYEDNSEIMVKRIFYSSDNKAFVLDLEGNGWVDGKLSFEINDQEYVKKITLTQVDKEAQVLVKHLLSEEEEKFLDGENVNYFIRYGERADILIKEDSGIQKIEIKGEKKEAGEDKKTKVTLKDETGGLDLLPIVAVVVIVIIALFVFKNMRGGGDGF